MNNLKEAKLFFNKIALSFEEVVSKHGTELVFETFDGYKGFSAIFMFDKMGNFKELELGAKKT